MPRMRRLSAMHKKGHSMKKRVVIAGLGDTGLLVALNLYPDYEVIGISPKPCLLSGQELGSRLTRPADWKRNYLMPFSRYRKLRGMTILQGLITGIDTAAHSVNVSLADGREQAVPYDALVIASGVTNGFWRTAVMEDISTINDNINACAAELARAGTVAIIGAGATGVSTASNLKETHSGKAVHLFYSQHQPLPGYHPATRNAIETRLRKQGVVLHPGHRAIIPESFACNSLTTGAVSWSTGQPPFAADLTLWATGKTLPNNSFVPEAMLDGEGFVKADAHLRVPGFSNVFTVGDIAASDPNRSSARNAGFLTVAHNIRCLLEGREARMKNYRPSAYRWGSILGVQEEGMRVFTPKGSSVLMKPWFVRNLLFPLIVHKLIYKGVKAD